MAPNSANVCQDCYQIFDSKSRPSICKNCAKFFHKTKCLKEHTKNCKETPLPSTSNNLQPSLPQTSSPILPDNLPRSSNETVTVSTAVSSTVSTSSSSSSIPRTATFPSISSLTLNPSPRLDGLQTLVSFVPGNSTKQTPQSNTNPPPNSSSSAPPTHKKGGKKKQKVPPITAEQARINFLETELSAAQARIVILDKSIVDKDQELAVLRARVKILEEKLNKYFPKTKTSASANYDTSSHSPARPCTCTPQVSCCHSTPCSTHPTYCRAPPCSLRCHVPCKPGGGFV